MLQNDNAIFFDAESGTYKFSPYLKMKGQNNEGAHINRINSAVGHPGMF